MNGKKAKALRRLAKENGNYQKEPVYREYVTKKLAYGMENGKQVVKEVEKITLINTSRLMYRRIKKTYKDGLFGI